MTTPAETTEVRFSVGQVIHHRLFDYRGVIADVDATFQGTEQWYEAVARSQPPKDEPWYHVLVDGASHTTYVAEQNLESGDGGPIKHPFLSRLFSGFENGHYVCDTQIN